MCNLPRKRKNRHGTLSLELLLIMPILVAVLSMTVLFGMILVAQQTVTAASQIGARAASLANGDCTVAENAVQSTLGGKLQAASVVTCSVDPVAGTVTVTVSVNAKDVMPDLLKGFGLCLDNIVISATTTMPIE